MKKRELEEAAFWDGHVCLACDVVLELGMKECPDCGAGGVEAKLLTRFVEGVGGENDED